MPKGKKSKNNVYVIIRYGGTMDCRWEQVESIYRDQATAKRICETLNKELKKYDDELLRSIKAFVLNKQIEESLRFFDPNNDFCMIESMEEEYYDAIEIFNSKTKYKLIKEKFGISKKEMMKIEEYEQTDTDGYKVCTMPVL